MSHCPLRQHRQPCRARPSNPPAPCSFCSALLLLHLHAAAAGVVCICRNFVSRLRLPPPHAAVAAAAAVLCVCRHFIALLSLLQKVWYVLGSKWWQLWRAFVRFDDEKEPPPSAAATESATPCSMDEDGVLVKAEDVAGVVVKADTNEHRVAELSLEEGGDSSSGGERESSYTERAGPGPIDNRTLGEGRELRETLVSRSADARCVCKTVCGFRRLGPQAGQRREPLQTFSVK